MFVKFFRRSDFTETPRRWILAWTPHNPTLKIEPLQKKEEVF
jgi:hypothetical protein